jgi:c-di-GMP-binding flagellar brake protein YcgR
VGAPVKHRKRVSPENALYLSHTEICRILQELSESRIAIIADVGTSWTFVSHILLVDPREDYFVISYCANKLLNSIVLERPALMFSATYQDAHLAFEVSSPVETRFDGQPALRYALPKTLTYHHRREYPRVRIPAEVSLRCVADAGGVIPFESHIVDISQGGLGIMIYDRDVKLEPETVLKGCRIIMPGGKAIVADVIVRHVTRVHLPDGTVASQAGLRFIQRSEEIAELVGLFIRNLDQPPAT